MEGALKQKQEVPVAIGETIVNAFATLKRLAVDNEAAIACGALLLFMAANLLLSISRKSITNDEVIHIPAGYYHLVAGEFQINNEHPPLIKMWAALPLLFLQPNEPHAPKTENENSMERTWGFHAAARLKERVCLLPIGTASPKQFLVTRSTSIE